MSSRRVLVVEDSPTMTQLLIFTLKKVRGVEVVAAGNGVDGLKKIANEKYDLILTDINMPLMDGLKFVKLVRGDKANSNSEVPIIIITTEGEEGVRDNGLKLGANSYITKPIDSLKVVDTVRKFLQV